MKKLEKGSMKELLIVLKKLFAAMEYQDFTEDYLFFYMVPYLNLLLGRYFPKKNLEMFLLWNYLLIFGKSKVWCIWRIEETKCGC